MTKINTNVFHYLVLNSRYGHGCLGQLGYHLGYIIRAASEKTNEKLVVCWLYHLFLVNFDVISSVMVLLL